VRGDQSPVRAKIEWCGLNGELCGGIGGPCTWELSCASGLRAVGSVDEPCGRIRSCANGMVGSAVVSTGCGGSSNDGS